VCMCLDGATLNPTQYPLYSQQAAIAYICSWESKCDIFTVHLSLLHLKNYVQIFMEQLDLTANVHTSKLVSHP
jgi:hypothetical protein